MTKFRKKPVVVEAVKWVGYFDIMPLRTENRGPVMLSLGLGTLDAAPDWLSLAVSQGLAEIELLKHAKTGEGANYEVKLRLRTLETNKAGWFEVSPGDWVVKGVRGELYAVKSDIFKETYEEAVDNAPVDEPVYFTLRKVDGGYRPFPSSSLDEAKHQAKVAVVDGHAAFVSVCQEILIYSRSYSVVERPATKMGKGTTGEA